MLYEIGDLERKTLRETSTKEIWRHQICHKSEQFRVSTAVDTCWYWVRGWSHLQTEMSLQPWGDRRMFLHVCCLQHALLPDGSAKIKREVDEPPPGTLVCRWCLSGWVSGSSTQRQSKAHAYNCCFSAQNTLCTSNKCFIPKKLCLRRIGMKGICLWLFGAAT